MKIMLCCGFLHLVPPFCPIGNLSLNESVFPFKKEISQRKGPTLAISTENGITLGFCLICKLLGEPALEFASAAQEMENPECG